MSGPWPLPDGWRWVAFGDVARVAADLVDPAGYLDMPHVAPNHIEAGSGRLLPYASVRDDGVTSAKHRFYPGQLLYSKIRPYLAKVVLVDFQGLCSADMYPLETSLEPRFLKWWMLTREFTRQAAGQQARTVLPKINKASLLQLLVPVPPREEQQRVVETLEQHLSRLDAAEQLLAASRDRLRPLELLELQRSMDQSRASYVPLSAFVERVEAGRSFGGSASPAKADEWGIVKVSAMTWGAFRPTENKAVPESAVDPRFEIKPGDLLVSRANTTAYVGAAVLVGETRPKLLLSDKSLRLVVRPGIDPRWLLAALTSPRTRSQISALATGTKDSMRNISQANLLGVQLPDEDADGRARIIQLRELSAARGRRLAGELVITTAKVESLRRSLLSAAFSGQLTSAAKTNKFEEMARV